MGRVENNWSHQVHASNESIILLCFQKNTIIHTYIYIYGLPQGLCYDPLIKTVYLP